MKSKNSSTINVEAAHRILNESISIVNDMIDNQRRFKREINEMTYVWRGGGNSPSSALLTTLRECAEVYNQMSLVISDAMKMITAIKVASNNLYSSYSGSTEKLFK